MSEFEWLDRDARLMIELLRELGEPVGNQAPRERLEWKQTGRFTGSSYLRWGWVRHAG